MTALLVGSTPWLCASCQSRAAAPEITAVRPAQVLVGVESVVRIEGGHLSADVSAKLDRSDPVALDRRFVVRLDDTRLAPPAIVPIDSTALDITVPATLPLGHYDVSVTTPAGLTATRADGLEVVEWVATGGDAGTGAEPTTRRRLTFDTTGLAEELVAFPVLVVLDDAWFDYAALQSSGQDLRFFAADATTVLAHEIESWDSAGRSCVWVNVPRLTSGSDGDHIWMYYGDPDAGDGQDAAGTWSNGYEGVWHLHRGVADSTSHQAHGTDLGSTDAAGQIAAGRGFDGVDAQVDLGAPAALARIFDGGGTLSAWIHPDGWGGDGYGRFIHRTLGAPLDQGWVLQVNVDWLEPRSLVWARDFSAAPGRWVTPTDSISLGDWHHVVVTYDDSSATNQPRIYVNGAPLPLTMGDQPAGNADDTAAIPLQLGSTGGQRSFDGVIDEVRIASTVRSQAWVAMQHRSMTNALITYGDEEQIPPP